MTASAPGKVLWAGEYAVLEGSPALVMAVNRRASASCAGPVQARPPFLEAVRATVAEVCGVDSEAARRAACVHVDSSALSEGGRKLGLGSSAATTVAAVAVAVGAVRDSLLPPAAVGVGGLVPRGPDSGALLPPAAVGVGGLVPRDPDSDDYLRRIHSLAHRAHGAAQAALGARGSGADVAASVYGGLLAVARAAEARESDPLAASRLALPAGLDFVLLWTGVPAHTPGLVARIQAFARRDPAAHRTAMDALAGAARAALAACRAGASTALVDALAQGAEAVAGLAARSGTPLEPPGFADLAARARAHHGTLKTTGAGGGDILLAAFADGEAGAAFRRALAACPQAHTLPVRLEPRGVTWLAHEPGTAYTYPS